MGPQDTFLDWAEGGARARRRSSARGARRRRFPPRGSGLLERLQKIFKGVETPKPREEPKKEEPPEPADQAVTVETELWRRRG